MTEQLSSSGAAPYVIPGGGSSAVGAQGYVVAADEVRSAFDTEPLLVCAVGTAGTYAGLVVGCGAHADVMGVDVNAVPGIEDQIPELVAGHGGTGRACRPSGIGGRRSRPARALRATDRAHDGRAAVGGHHRGHRARPRLHRAGHGRSDRRRAGAGHSTWTGRRCSSTRAGLPGLFVDAVTPWVDPPGP